MAEIRKRGIARRLDWGVGRTFGASTVDPCGIASMQVSGFRFVQREFRLGGLRFLLALNGFNCNKVLAASAKDTLR